jgi:transposase-like protein
MDAPHGPPIFYVMEDRLRRRERAVGELRRARFSLGVACPRCRERRVQRWGSFSGRRRYRCTACLRTFSDLTATPVARLKKVELIEAYAGCLANSLSIRAAARAVGVAPSTAFRWRHRLLRDLEKNRRETLKGWIELTTRRVPVSYKGQRHLDRAARRRGPAPGRAPPQTSVVIAIDRYGSVVSASIPNGRVSSRDLEESIGRHVVDRPLVIAAEGRLGAASFFARRAGGIFRDARRARGIFGRARRVDGQAVYSVEAARAYALALETWMERFHGVATKYLPNYLAWHRALTYGTRHGSAEPVLGWPAFWPNSLREQSRRVGRGTGTPPRPGLAGSFGQAPTARPFPRRASSRDGP